MPAKVLPENKPGNTSSGSSKNPPIPTSSKRRSKVRALIESDLPADFKPKWAEDQEDSPTGIWYYEVAAFNAACGAEGPR